MNACPHNEWIILEKLVGVILENVPGCIVEIGSGVSTLILADQARSSNSKLYTCDSMLNQIKMVTEVAKYENLITFYGKSRDFMKTFNDTPSVVLLDGSHRLVTVREEVKFFLDKLNVGGVLFIHDTCPWKETVEKKVALGKKIDTYLIRKELENDKTLDVFTWRYTASKCGLTMVLKKDMSEPEYRV
jgi:predicted O-methyltransferase YrrM